MRQQAHTGRKNDDSMRRALQVVASAAKDAVGLNVLGAVCRELWYISRGPQVRSHYLPAWSRRTASLTVFSSASAAVGDLVGNSHYLPCEVCRTAPDSTAFRFADREGFTSVLARIGIGSWHVASYAGPKKRAVRYVLHPANGSP